MNGNPLASKIALPYARAFYDYAVQKDTLYKTTTDIRNLNTFLKTSNELMSYLKNPLIANNQKQEILNKTLKKRVCADTFKFLTLLVNRNRINLLDSIIEGYVRLMYKTALVKNIEIESATPFTNRQRNLVIKRLKELTSSREIQLTITVDPSLIGGFLVKTESKIIDFTIKNELKKLSKHLDSVLDI